MDVEEVVRRNISGVCDSHVLHIISKATDTDFISLAGQRYAYIKEIHRISEIVCPSSVKNSSGLLDYLVGCIRKYRYSSDLISGLDDELNRDYSFSVATLPPPSILRILASAVGTLFGINMLCRYYKFCRDNINESTIDSEIILKEALKSFSGSDIPPRYIAGLEAALNNP